MGVAHDTGSKAEQVGDSTTLEMVARAGLVAYGLVHLLIGWLAPRIAWSGSAGKSSDTSGAMAAIAAQPFGKILLWLVALGLMALALWKVIEAIWGHRYQRGAALIRDKLTSAAMAVVYAALGVSAASFSEGIDNASLSPGTRTTVMRLGQIGYIAKGLALGVAGALLTYATLSFQQQNTQGLDGAMQAILAQPFGQFLLTAVALGVVALGLFAILQARYRHM
jgi:hypothetical protein